jgi:predicted adenine nucleotide alpha hydrolase (AANH) superfamily ATPase
MRVLLHICCGVCAAGAAAELLSEGHRVTGYFYNPNIFPREEYQNRLEAAHTACRSLGLPLEQGSFAVNDWLEAIKGLEGEPEGGERCRVCYRLRLEKAYKFMLSSGMDAFTTTLTISPHKLAAIVNKIGEDIGGDMFLQRDFKKKDGFKKAIALSRQLDLYRQDYCGCRYSRKGGKQ